MLTSPAVLAEPSRALRVVFTAAPVIAVAVAFSTHAEVDLYMVVPAVTALAALSGSVLGGPAARAWLAPVLAVACVVTLLGTIAWLRSSDGSGGAWSLLNTAALMLNVAMVCRWSPGTQAIGASALTTVSIALLGLPVVGTPFLDLPEAASMVVFWALPGLAGIGAGTYLRHLDTHKELAIAEARRAQRFQLAADLHDYVAHDVSAMVVQSQAATVLLRTDPAAVGEVLARIEADGTRALTAMDQTIHMLRSLESGTAQAAPESDLSSLEDLVKRFTVPGDGPAELRIEPGLIGQLRPEASTTVYRVVVEALTNVRRHAGAGSTVTVDLQRAPAGVVLSVTNRGGKAVPAPGRRQSRLGLLSLSERVEAIGGRFAAGALPGNGWRVRVELPEKLLVEPL